MSPGTATTSYWPRQESALVGQGRTLMKSATQALCVADDGRASNTFAVNCPRDIKGIYKLDAVWTLIVVSKPRDQFYLPCKNITVSATRHPSLPGLVLDRRRRRGSPPSEADVL